MTDIIMPSATPQTTILVIDDDPDITATIKGNLELDGYHVLCAQDGRIGLDMAEAHRPGLILLDLNLPDIDGIKACQIIRRKHDLPLIILTARDSVTDKVLGLECGADDYMVKPFNALELSARIKAVLNRAARCMVHNRLQIGSLNIDFKNRRVSRDSVEINLTKTEYELLELFTVHIDEVLSREFIRQQIWRDSQLYKQSRTVDVHVQRLRKKIEPDPNKPQYLITIAGVGYQLQRCVR